MKDKRGFTLVEVIVVLVIIGLIGAVIAPKIASVFGDSVKKTMRVQENEIKDAALIYLEDYCKNPIGNNKCSLTKNEDYNYSGQVSLTTLVNADYIDKVTLQGDECSGCVIFDHNSPSVYIRCGESYETENYSCR